jgi:hypothetical protein
VSCVAAVAVDGGYEVKQFTDMIKLCGDSILQRISVSADPFSTPTTGNVTQQIRFLQNMFHTYISLHCPWYAWVAELLQRPKKYVQKAS